MEVITFPFAFMLFCWAVIFKLKIKMSWTENDFKDYDQDKTQAKKEIDFDKKRNNFFSPFLLYNEYSWLVEHKGLDPNDYDDSQINNLIIS